MRFTDKFFRRREGFTLIELLIVIAILGILYSFAFSYLTGFMEDARFARAKAELSQVAKATQQWVIAHGGVWPDDVDRAIPPGIQEYLGPGEWPEAPWEGSVYDWDNATVGGETYYQISIRFCPLGQPSQCNFPDQDWADDFDYYSSVYFCMGGPCRAHPNKPVSHPGYCLNCQ
ncbi:type II secretion system protein [Candidatus Peribacteria bacterium]|nr:type II secretion system protein [Candidatus Peribacteria bacterium]